MESRSVPAVVSTSRLLLICNLWAAECTRCFLYFKWVFPVVNILMLWCMFAVFQCCFVSYVLCVYCAHFHSLHERPSCQNGILFTPSLSFSLRVGPDFKWVLPVADIYWCCDVYMLFCWEKKQHLTIMVYIRTFCVCTVHNVMFCVIFAWNGFVAAWKRKLLYQAYLVSV